MFRKIPLLLSTLFMTTCTQASLAVVNLPTKFSDTTIIHDVAYGPATLQKLDIYIPADAGTKKMDVIVFFYGGRWSFGQKEDYQFVGTALAEQGFAVVIPDYRKYPAVHFPVFVQDGAKALAWTYNHIDAYHGDANHIYVAGHSAGAHIGALIAVDAHYLADEGKKRSDVIRGFIGLAGPYAFTPDEPDLEDMFGPPANYPTMRVTTFVDGKQPPMLLLQGADDKTVKRENLDRLEQAVHDKGGRVQSTIYPHTDHIGILKDFTWIGNSDAPVLQDLTNFIRATDARPSYR